MVDQVFEKRSIQNRRRLKLLAGDGRADNGEDSRTNNGADAEGRQAQPSQRFL